MGLNIKNQRVHDLATEAARVTGKTKTGAIEEALERLLKDYGSDPHETERRHRLDVVFATLAELDGLPRRPGFEDFSDHDLYDEDGLPR